MDNNKAPPKKYKKKALSKKTPPKFKRTYLLTAPPNSQTVKLRYTENITLTSLSITNTNGYIFRINDLFDPNYSGSGHQSYFRDQMFAMYNYGKVLWASIKITVIVPNTSSFLIVLGPNQSGTLDTDIQTASERKGSKETYINQQFLKTMTCASSSDYYFGEPKGSTRLGANYAQSSSTSLSSANSMWYQIMLKELNSTTNGVYIKIDLEQITRFEGPYQQSGS